MATKNFIKKVVCTQAQYDAIQNKQEGVEYNIIGNPTVVSVSGSGTSTSEVSYITINGVESKLAGSGGGTPTNMVTTNTDQTISGAKTFTQSVQVVDTDGNVSIGVYSNGNGSLESTSGNLLLKPKSGSKVFVNDVSDNNNEVATIGALASKQAQVVIEFLE